jgi:hypothetical protein
MVNTRNSARSPQPALNLDNMDIDLLENETEEEKQETQEQPSFIDQDRHLSLAELKNIGNSKSVCSSNTSQKHNEICDLSKIALKYCETEDHYFTFLKKI